MQKRGLFHFLACALHTEPNRRGEGCHSELLLPLALNCVPDFQDLDLVL